MPQTLLWTGCCTRLLCIKIFSIFTVYKMSFVLFGVTVLRCYLHLRWHYLLLPPPPIFFRIPNLCFSFEISLFIFWFVFLLHILQSRDFHPVHLWFQSVPPFLAKKPRCCQVDLWGSQTEHFLPPQLNSLMLVTVTTGKLSRVITPGPRRRSHSPLFNPLSPCSSFLCESWHWQSWYWSTSSSSSPWWWQQGKWWEGARRWRGLGPPGHDLRINTAHRHQMQHSITMHSITLQCTPTNKCTGMQPRVDICVSLWAWTVYTLETV